jgi:DNA-binding transcriptional MerR regulator
MTLLAPRDVGRRLNLSTSRVIQLDREGILPAFRDSSGRRLYHAEAVEQFARERDERRSARDCSALLSPLVR